jgi:hypothetical protein
MAIKRRDFLRGAAAWRVSAPARGLPRSKRPRAVHPDPERSGIEHVHPTHRLPPDRTGCGQFNGEPLNANPG